MTNLPIFFRQRSEIVSLKVRERRTYLFLFKNHFSSNCSAEHPDSIFDELANYFRKKLDKYLQMKYKNDEKNVYFTKKLVKAFAVHLKCGSYDLAWIFLPEVRKNFSQSVEVEKKQF